MSLVSDQIYALLFTVLAGICVGFIFDIYRIFRNSVQPKHWVSVLYDLMFWLIVIPLVFLMLLVSNWGELRYYVLLGLGLGMFLYFQLLSSYVLWSSMMVLRALGATLVGISRFFIILFLTPIRLLTAVRLVNSPKAFLSGGPKSSFWRPVPPLRWRGARIFKI